MKKHLLTLLLFLGVFSLAQAQRSISGKVTDAKGEALIGASVLVKGSTGGTVSNIDGTYSISVPTGSNVLIFSYTGFNTVEVTIGTSNTVDATLEEGILLEEAVVTALGIKRSEKSLTYAAQQINNEQLTIIRQTNINNALAGKIAGVQVRSQSSMKLNSGASIRIRGAGSLSDKGPLYVVDGTPVTNSFDFNMDDVESVTVLKGPNATAIYGQRGDAGVIVVTTKKGNKGKGIGVEVNQSTFFDKVYILPDYQNTHAGGGESDLIKFTWNAGMPADWKALDGKFYHDYEDDASWGPKMTGQEYIPWYSWYKSDKNPYYMKTAKLEGQPNNIRDFYNTGITTLNNVNFKTGGDNYNLRVSLTNQGAKGMLPNSGSDKYTVATNTNVDLGKYITIGANINYVTNKITGEFSDGYSNNSTGSFNSWFHRDLDFGKMKELQGMTSPEGYLASWNHYNVPKYNTSPRNFYAANYWYNPYDYFNNRNIVTNTRRFFGDVNLTAKLSDKFKITGFIRRNEYQTDFEDKLNNILQLSGLQTGYFNAYSTQLTYFREDNYEAIATYADKFGDISVEANAGVNMRTDKSKSISGSTSQGLNVPDLFTVGNSKVAQVPSEGRSLKKVNSVYARGSFGYKSLLYLDWSARNDWSSALPADANSYFYPSLGTSFVFSELTADALPFLSFGKVRASVAQVGSDLGAYQLDLFYGLNANQWTAGNFLMATPDGLIDAGIKPSLSSALEFGTDLKFFNNRVGLSATYFKEKKINEILSIPITSASGFGSKLINAGRIDRWGVEIALDLNPIKTRDLNWDVTLNFANIDNEVKELTAGITEQLVGVNSAFTGFGVRQVNVVGEKWGQLRGGAIKRDAQGRAILDKDGLYTSVPNQYLGSVLPDVTGGFISQLTYKNFSFSFNIDYSFGGKYYSLSDAWGKFSGLFAATGALNDKGNNVRDDVSAGGGVKVEGVNAAGEPVSMYADGFNYFHQFVNRGIAEDHLFDLSFVKLREVSFGYSIPVANTSFAKFIQGATISLVARNPWLIYAQNRDFDPSELAGTFGENGQFPGTRSIGFNLKLQF